MGVGLNWVWAWMAFGLFGAGCSAGAAALAMVLGAMNPVLIGLAAVNNTTMTRDEFRAKVVGKTPPR